MQQVLAFSPFPCAKQLACSRAKNIIEVKTLEPLFGESVGSHGGKIPNNEVIKTLSIIYHEDKSPSGQSWDVAVQKVLEDRCYSTDLDLSMATLQSLEREGGALP